MPLFTPVFKKMADDGLITQREYLKFQIKEILLVGTIIGFLSLLVVSLLLIP